MFKRSALMTAAGLFVAITASAQTPGSQAPAAGQAKAVAYDITITADNVYTGTMELTAVAGKVTGKMKLTSPTEILGEVAGTAQAGSMALEFPFHMTENACDGTVKMTLKVTAADAPVTGTMQAVGCGREEADKVTGTVELKPSTQKPAAPR